MTNTTCSDGTASILLRYDATGRQISATDAAGTTVTAYNDRNELTNAVKNATQNEHVYQYDGIGNRLSSLDLGEWREYESNNLNQYASIAEGEDDFAPQFDLDGNQTLIRTTTGDWQVTYNGENRPVSWTCGTTNIVMSFDRMGRRVQYVESVNGITNSHISFVYDGYLQIANTDAVAETEQRFVWDPTEPVATRPFVLYSGVDTQLYLFAVERCCIEKYANSDDCNCCMRSKATVIARVFWQANNYQFVINEVSAQRKKRMDMTLHRLVDGKTFLLPCKQYKEDHGIKRGKEVMPSTVELKFPPDSIYSR